MKRGSFKSEATHTWHYYCVVLRTESFLSISEITEELGFLIFSSSLCFLLPRNQNSPLMDRISNLPDEIISHIGWFLSAKDVACAKVLSRRWRNLFTIVPELTYNDMDEDRFMDFEERVSSLPIVTRVKRFCLTSQIEYSDTVYIDRCLSLVVKLGIVDLELDVIRDVEEDEEEEEDKEKYSVPWEVFTCETVARLDLGRNLSIDVLPRNVYLPSLKKLVLHSVRFYELDRLLSACPVLEELGIHDFEGWKCSRSISSSTLKRLALDNDFDDWGYDDEVEYESFCFDTPALTYLHYTDFARKEYPVVNLNSLVEAKLGVYKEEGTLCDPRNLFNGLKNVKILRVTDQTLELIHEFREAFPMLDNLSRLTLVNEGKCCWFGLQVLIQKSPRLKTLTIEGSLHFKGYDRFEPLCECLLGYSFLMTSRIKILKIAEFRGRDGEISQLKQVLKKLPYLELAKIHVKGFDEDKERKIKKELLTIPRGSSKWRIQVVNGNAEMCDEEEEEENEAASGQCEAIVSKTSLRCKRNAAEGSKWCWQRKEEKKKTSSPEESQ